MMTHQYTYIYERFLGPTCGYTVEDFVLEDREKVLLRQWTVWVEVHFKKGTASRIPKLCLPVHVGGIN